MVNQDTLQLIGRVIPPGQAPGRDAVHVAVTPAVAAVTLRPGQRVAVCDFDDGRVHVVAHRGDGPPAGVVDPYLEHDVLPGWQVWVFLMPQTVTSLRHVWRHPLFPDEPPPSAPQPGPPAGSERRAASIGWLTDYARDLGVDHAALVAMLDAYLATGRPVTLPDELPDRVYVYEDRRQLWHHYTVVTGYTPPDRTAEKLPFRCSC